VDCNNMCYMPNHQKLINLAEYRLPTSLLATQGFLRRTLPFVLS
jgi:hypothetical protein